jgi:ribosomal protein S6--L-glutamate ligase
MKVAILSRGPKLYSTRRLKEACRRAGHNVKVYDPLAFAIDVAAGQPNLRYGGKPFARVDAVIPRVGAANTLFATAVLRQFEQIGVYSVNSAQAMSVSRDKLRSMQILSRHRIGLPKTAFVHDLSQIAAAIDQIGGPPVVIKLLSGAHGLGVILAESKQGAESIVEALQVAAQQNALIQQFVHESRGRDIRAFVVGHRVVAAMRRIADGDEFRSNIHRGGRAEKVVLDAEYERTALHAAQILGLRVAGVDMLEGRDGPLVTEVNGSPGLEGIELATSVDVAGAIVQLIEDEVLFPEIDIRQRLTIQSGYAVIEIPVAPRSQLAGKTLRESGLLEQDVRVLTIHRGGVSLPNPRDGQRIAAGDTLLCFGETRALKRVAPLAAARLRRARPVNSVRLRGTAAAGWGTVRPVPTSTWPRTHRTMA